MTTRIDLDRVVSLLDAEGVDAGVRFTGGGVLALIAGPTRDDPASCPGDGWQLAAVIVGPGRADGGVSVADVRDLVIGAEGDETTEVEVGDLGVTVGGDEGERALADLIAARSRAASAA